MADKKQMRTVVGIVLVVVAAVAVVVGIQRSSLAGRAKRDTRDVTYTYKCSQCGEIFEMDEATADKHIKAGRVKSPPNEYRQFPCEKCGEIAAYYYEDKYL